MNGPVEFATSPGWTTGCRAQWILRSDLIYDIIGDIHGFADELVELLERLGYHNNGDFFAHPNRRAVFCGDFIDRGPQIRDTVNIVRRMVEHHSALAVMGNHEFNAIAFHTPRPDEPHGHFRRHTERNVMQHQATLDQFAADELEDALKWFRGLPVALDLGPVRVVHACWDDAGIALLNEGLTTASRFGPDFLTSATDPCHPLGMAVERVLKGPEIALPNDMSVKDKEGNVRRRVRIRWFQSPNGHSLGSYAFPAVRRMSEVPVPATARPSPYPPDAPPVFFGHYWLNGHTPEPLAPNVACLDYSVAKHGLLCGYRLNGEATLSADRFVTVSARNRQWTSDDHEHA